MTWLNYPSYLFLPINSNPSRYCLPRLRIFFWLQSLKPRLKTGIWLGWPSRSNLFISCSLIYIETNREMLGKKSLSSDFFSARMISSICLLIRFLLRIIIKSLMVTLSLSQICPPLIMSKSLIYVWFMHDLVFSFWWSDAWFGWWYNLFVE